MTLPESDIPGPRFRLERTVRPAHAFVFEASAHPEIFKIAAVDLAAMRRRHDAAADLEHEAGLLAPLELDSERWQVQLAARLLEAGPDLEEAAARARVSMRDPIRCKRGDIEGWSARSRMRMVQALGSVEMSGRFAMLTLTYPGEWYRTPDGRWRTPDVVRAERAAFRKRFERRWGPLYGAWKLETQRRGAPHLHISLRLPDGIPWTEVWTWCRRNWHDLVCHTRDSGCSSACDQTSHLHRGAHMDARFADRIREGRSTIASYFAKHGTWRSKEYQNLPPNVAISQARWLVRTLAPAGDLLERTRIAHEHARAIYEAFGVPVNRERLAADLPDVLEEWRTFAHAWSTPGRWWGLWRLERKETARDDCVDHETVRVARLICRKVIGRRTQRSTFVQREDGSLLEVPVRRTMRSLHGYSDCGWWMTARDGHAFFWWLLEAARARAHLSGRPLAVSIAGLELPDFEPVRARRPAGTFTRRVAVPA